MFFPKLHFLLKLKKLIFFIKLFLLSKTLQSSIKTQTKKMESIVATYPNVLHFVMKMSHFLRSSYRTLIFIISIQIATLHKLRTKSQKKKKIQYKF